MKIYKPAAIAAIISCVTFSSCSSSHDGDDMPYCPPTGVRTARIASVVYKPAPGQFVNEMPEYEAGMTDELMQQAALANLQNGRGVSLGALGGYVIIALEEPISHRADGKDFKVLGNAFKGSSEPGVVEVSADGSHWYALAGQDWDTAQRNYRITYYIPAENASPQQYIGWTSDSGDSGWIMRNPGFHTDHSYFPRWDGEVTSMTFTAIKLRNNWTFDNTTGNYVGNAMWGYADSFSNSSDDSWLNLANAVDDNNSYVTVSNIRYIKVTTGVLDSNEVTGECSTEVMGIQIINE